jgi:hypothetical protein
MWALGAGALAAALMVALRSLVIRARRREAEVPTVASDPKRAELRSLIHFVLKSDAELTAFCFDHFERQVYHDFSDGMERNQKITILMRDVRPEDIRTRLREQYPDEVAEFERTGGKGSS